MSNAKDISVTDMKLKMLVYGKSGTGKTSFACSFPKPYVFDFDGGLLSQRGKDVEYDTYNNWKTANDKLNLLQYACSYDTLVLDSITTMQEYIMQDVLLASGRKVPTLHEWGRLIDALQDVLMRITKIAKHVVVVAHEQILQDELTSEILIQPLVVGKKLPGQLPLWFDEVYRMQVGRDKNSKPVYQIITKADTRYSAKSRIGILDTITNWSNEGVLVNPYDIIMKKLGGQ